MDQKNRPITVGSRDGPLGDTEPQNPMDRIAMDVDH